MGKKKNKGGDEYSLERVIELANTSGASILIRPTGATGTGMAQKKDTSNYTSGNEPDLSPTDALYHSMHTNISSIKSDLSDTKTDLNITKNNMQGKVDDLRKELEGKIDTKIDGKYFWGAVSVLVLLGVVIYSLSYEPLISKVNQFEQKFSSKEDLEHLRETVNANNNFTNSTFATKTHLGKIEDTVKNNSEEIKLLGSSSKNTGTIGKENKAVQNN